MTLLLLMNLGFGATGVVGPAFKPAWAQRATTYLGPQAPPQPESE